MGYTVDVSGRLLLPEDREAEVLEFLRERVGDVDWWPERPDLPVREELGVFLNAECLRHGEWLVLSPDRLGDPKWSLRATRRYLWLSHLVSEGEVRVEGEHDETWSYVYAPDRFTQVGRNGYDGSPIPTAADWDPGDPPEYEAEERREAERAAERQRRREQRLWRRLLGR